MVYLERRPSPPLLACIEMLWYASAPELPHQRELVLPQGKIQFVISLANDHLTDCTEAGDVPAAPALLVGARISAELVATRDMKRLVGVIFRPGGLGPWLRERASVFYEQSLSLCDIWQMQPWRERMRETDSPHAALQILDEALCRHAPQPQRRNHVCRAVHLLNRLNVHETAIELGISERRLHLIFSEDVGLSPKQYGRVRRFQRAVHALHQGVDMKWAELALSCGYSDQAHFSRDFRAFSGVDPTTYVASRGPWKNHIALS